MVSNGNSKKAIVTLSSSETLQRNCMQQRPRTSGAFCFGGIGLTANASTLAAHNKSTALNHVFVRKPCHTGHGVGPSGSVRKMVAGGRTIQKEEIQ